jgi:hypothetical protein
MFFYFCSRQLVSNGFSYRYKFIDISVSLGFELLEWPSSVLSDSNELDMFYEGREVRDALGYIAFLSKVADVSGSETVKIFVQFFEVDLDYCSLRIHPSSSLLAGFLKLQEETCNMHTLNSMLLKYKFVSSFFISVRVHFSCP